MKKGEKLLFLAGILLAIGALAFSAWKLRGIYGEYQEGEDTYEELASFVEEPEDTPKPDGGAVSLRTGITSRILRIRTPLYTATI